MKRITAIFLCLVLVCTLAITASAASAHMSISSSGSTVYRGEEFTLTINLSNTLPISNAAIILNYDASIFEMTGGTCVVNNTAASNVSAAIGGGTFAFEQDVVVSGTIFIINMKVKENASFGNYSISGTVDLASAGTPTPCGISGTSVTVSCKHSFGAASKVDGNNHQSTCSICGETKKEAHTWDSGTVTKAPTCKDTGTKKLTCTACGVEKTESVPVTSDHKFGDWDTLGYEGHSRKCSVCGKEESDDHSWYIYEIEEESTCQSTGLAILLCEDCGASAEQELELADHSYGAPTDVTDTQHTHKCSVCGEKSTGDHTFGDTLEHDDKMHYYVCEGCGYKKDQAEHVPGPAATEETDQVCTVCDRILKPKGAHVHQFKTEWSSDGNNHWHDCLECPARDTEMPHVFDSDCDAACNVCGMTRQVTHLPLPNLESDATGHWYSCLVCGEKQNFSAHTPGPAATITTAQTCTECGFEIAPILPHDHVYNGNGTVHSHKCACGKEYDADAESCGICAEAHKHFPWWIVCILEALVFGGIILLLLMRKKKSPPKKAKPLAKSKKKTADEVDDLLDQLLTEEEPADEASDEADELLKKFLAE